MLSDLDRRIAVSAAKVDHGTTRDRPPHVGSEERLELRAPPVSAAVAPTGSRRFIQAPQDLIADSAAHDSRHGVVIHASPLARLLSTSRTGDFAPGPRGSGGRPESRRGLWWASGHRRR